MYHVSQLPQLLPVVFVQPQTQTWIKEADENKMQDICNKETKTTAASLVQLWRARIGCFLQPDKRGSIFKTLKVFGQKFSLSLRLVLALSVLLIMAGVEQNPGPPRRTPASATQATSSTRQTRLTSSDTGNLSFTQRNEQSPGSETDNENTSLFSMLAA